MSIERLISSDDHVIEPPNLWTERVGAEFSERVPRVIREDDADYWVVDGKRTNSFSGGVQTGKRFEDPGHLQNAARFEDVRPGGFEGAEHVADNMSDGVLGAVLYPTLGLSLYRSITDNDLLLEVCRIYNDWLVDFCAADPVRLKGIAMISLEDPALGVAELQRARDIGLSGAFIPVGVPRAESYDHEKYGPFWAAAQDLGMPISLHFGAVRAGASGSDAAFTTAGVSRTFFIMQEEYIRQSLADMIFSGVFERFPQLRVGSVEHELGWIPHFIDRLDYTYTQRQGNDLFLKFADGALPSDHFRRNVFCSFQEDRLGIEHRDIIGIDNLMFGSDYPHTESTFPYSLKLMTERLDGVPEDEQRKIVFDNVKKLYDFAID